MPKLDQQQFDSLIERMRGGDQAAATELVQTYEPEIRREVRLRLANSLLRRTLDSTDICQSIFGNFFVRAAIGQFEFENPQALVGMLAQMARNKLVDRHRKEKVRRPNGDAKLVFGELSFENEPTRKTATPSADIAAKDLHSRVQKQLTKPELEIAQMRRDGCSWEEIANAFGESPDALRKRLTRAGDRILKELDLDQ